MVHHHIHRKNHLLDLRRTNMQPQAHSSTRETPVTPLAPSQNQKNNSEVLLAPSAQKSPAQGRLAAAIGHPSYWTGIALHPALKDLRQNTPGVRALTYQLARTADLIHHHTGKTPTVPAVIDYARTTLNRGSHRPNYI